ncbi:MAG: right-handed parallel beta-helix repeat-containing protein, partial [Actinobacteria bacterium]|nr:right-handed parallel beta-helix repeat-containing protein [Actinomycetota bacterium]
PGNTVGTAASANVIDGNLGHGVFVVGDARGNTVAGNYIGLNNTGDAALGNGLDGVHVEAQANTVGPNNIISGNTGDGVSVSVNGNLGNGNAIINNQVGTDSKGSKPVPNQKSGVNLDAPGNTVRGNLISGNAKDGIRAVGIHAHDNVVAGNTVGLNKVGTSALANGLEGVEVGGPNNRVGGTAVADRNVISGNGRRGVALTGINTTGNLIQGNYIGTNRAGSAAIPNGDAGVLVYNFASRNTIGGTAKGAGNVISGNRKDGVFLAESNTTADVVQGNFIGTNTGGTAAVPNGGYGVVVRESANNTIGGTAAGAGNVIGGNALEGVRILGAGATGNLVQGNAVGTDLAGRLSLANNGNGVSVGQRASGNTVGGTAPGAGNTIAFNKGNGVAVGDSPLDPAAVDSILGNMIFSNGKLGIDLGSDGVTLPRRGGSHAGPNHFQNMPVLAFAADGPAGTVVGGRLDGLAG